MVPVLAVPDPRASHQRRHPRGAAAQTQRLKSTMHEFSPLQGMHPALPSPVFQTTTTAGGTAVLRPPFLPVPPPSRCATNPHIFDRPALCALEHVPPLRPWAAPAARSIFSPPRFSNLSYADL